MDDRAARQRKYEKWKEQFRKNLYAVPERPESRAAKHLRIAREKAESHREAYTRLTPEQAVNACIELETRALDWQRQAMSSRKEIGRLRGLIQMFMRVPGLKDEHTKDLKNVLRIND